jgi:membrane-associated phospholipid phosphatase
LPFLLFSSFFCAANLYGQARSYCPSSHSSSDIPHPAEHYLLRNLLCDQEHIWTSPSRLRLKDSRWLIPFAGVTTGLIMTDRTTSFELSRGNNINFSNHIADAGVALAGAGVLGFYGLGRLQSNDHLRETGVLAGEAMLNSAIVDEALKYSFGRERPLEGDRKGHFFRGGQSFPSEHSQLAWSFASVLASEYPGWLTKTLAYSGASAVSIARVTGKKHFTSDVFVGGALGYLTGKYVYKAHHNAELVGESYGTFVREEHTLSPVMMGSTYVPLDSWVYPALERLAALGAIHTHFLGLRPWTRISIAGLLSEAGDVMEQTDLEAERFYQDLQNEFSAEAELLSGGSNESIRLESLYTRAMYISGRPLNDSFHFGQTITNDFGRLYQQGFNQIAGITARAEDGRFSYYVRGEYQHAPAAPAYPLSVRQVIAQADLNPLQPATPFAEVNQFRLLDTYVATTFLGHQISIGKQSLWWGPGESGAMLMGDNAEPFYMLRVTRAVPFTVPLLGALRYDAFFGRLAGHSFPPRPFIHGEKISFKPTENLELGFSRTATFAGEGFQPLTAHTFAKSFFDVGSNASATANLAQNDPGDRRGGFDFSYRVPFLRNWLSIYSDSIADDDPSPLAAPRRSAFNPGFYLSHLPKLPKLDLRVEAVNTDRPSSIGWNGRFFYFNTNYHDSATNKAQIFGSWVGREGKGIQAWTTWWLSGQSRIQLGYRNAKVAKDFIPNGETLNDFSARTNLRIRRDLELGAFFQYERWNAPVLSSHTVSNYSSAIQVTFWPKGLSRSATSTH